MWCRLATNDTAKALLRNHTPFTSIEDLRDHFDVVIGTVGDIASPASRAEAAATSNLSRAPRSWARYPWELSEELFAGGVLSPPSSKPWLPGAGSQGREGAEARKVVVVFGREASGLTNSEMLACDYLVTIPTPPPAHNQPGAASNAASKPAVTPSLNLSHAVAVCMYELLRPRTVLELERRVLAPTSIPDTLAGATPEASAPTHSAVDPAISPSEQAALQRQMRKLTELAHVRARGKQGDKTQKSIKQLDSGGTTRQLATVQALLTRARLSTSEHKALMGFVGSAIHALNKEGGN